MSLGDRITRGRAIRMKCLDCCCGSAREVRLCDNLQCPLWRYRMGWEVPPASGDAAGDLGPEAPANTPAHPEEDSP